MTGVKPYSAFPGRDPSHPATLAAHFMFLMVMLFSRNEWHLWQTLVRQELAVRYRGTVLGWAWPVITPLLLLAVYGFVFGAVFKARWPGMAEGDQLAFTLNLFIGLLVHGLLAETLGRAPQLMQQNANFVRKVVFPLPVLVAVPLGSAMLLALPGFALVVLAHGLAGGGWHASTLALPLVLLPWLALVHGLALIFAALGVYVRDLAQITQALVMLVLFTGAVFFPRAMVPEALSVIVDLNPVTWPVEAARGALLHGEWPALDGLLLYILAALAVLALGRRVFATLQRGFADVL